MAKKSKKSVLDDDEKLKYESNRDRVKEIFRNHPGDYISKMEEIGFEYLEDDEDEEEIEERKSRPENQRQKVLVDYFEGRTELSEHILDSYFQEKSTENPNYPLIRKYFKQANKNLKSLLLYGLDNYPGRIDLLSDISFYHEYDNVLRILIEKYTQACVDQANLDTFSELAKDFYYSTNAYGYEAYIALIELFEPESKKRKIVESLMAEEEEVGECPF